MKPIRTLHLKITLVFFFLLSLSSINYAMAQEDLKTYYECPPCGCDDDGKISLTDGECPSCNMRLTEKSAREIPDVETFIPLKVLETPMNVAIFLYEYNQVLDYAGPYDAFVSAGSSFNVYTVGATKDAITTYPNLSINPQYSIQDAPKPDILIIPAGVTNSVNKETRKWILDSTKNATYLLSVCNGAFLMDS